MPRLLRLDSSADPRTSRSRAITRTFTAAWQSVSADHVVTYRDLHADPLPHLPDASLHWTGHQRPAGAAPSPAAEALQHSLIEELLDADALLVGAPMYNFTVPSTLKAWLDYIHVPGITASDPPDQSPLAGRPAIVIATRGAAYRAGSPEALRDHVIPVLELVLGTSLGMQVTVITSDLTLADTVPALAEHQQQATEQLAKAHSAAARTAHELGERVMDHRRATPAPIPQNR